MRRPLAAALAVAAVVVMLALLAGACGGGTAPPDKVTLQLNWFHEAEFVGYYVAQAKGFYAARHLDVTILQGGPGSPATDHVLNGSATFAISSFDEQKQLVAARQPPWPS